jgi:hypothetical protein
MNADKSPFRSAADREFQSGEWSLHSVLALVNVCFPG